MYYADKDEMCTCGDCTNDEICTCEDCTNDEICTCEDCVAFRNCEHSFRYAHARTAFGGIVGIGNDWEVWRCKDCGVKTYKNLV